MPGVLYFSSPVHNNITAAGCTVHHNKLSYRLDHEVKITVNRIMIRDRFVINKKDVMVSTVSMAFLPLSVLNVM
jgi:hypothetical protein